jgi:hypothetical protein
MTALSGPDGPRAAGISRLADRRIVAALAVGDPDGVDGRKVEHIEAHAGDIWQPGLAVGKCGVGSRRRAAGAREHLVPGTEPGLHRIDHHLQRLRVSGHLRTLRQAALHAGKQRGVERQPGFVFRALIGTQRGRAVGEPGSMRVVAGPGQGLLDERCTGEQIHGNILAGSKAFGQIATPAFKPVQPGADGVDIPAEFGDLEGGFPFVVGKTLQECRAPSR